MGKDDKDDSGFGFKDRAKAEETLRLLEAHEPNYRRLTVRGLLGRAKRVLSMTKAEEKIKNIKEAMEVFENWLADLDASKKEKIDKKTDKNDKEESNDVDMEVKSPKSPESPKDKPVNKDKPDKVPGLGFKDAAAAQATIQELEGRDPEYQRLAVNGLLGSARRVLASTRDETKVSNIKEAIAILEKYVEDFDSEHRSKLNNAYLSLGVVRTCLKLGGATDQQKAFVAAYASVGGEYKRLRTVREKEGEGEKTWDIVRNDALRKLKEKHSEAKLFNEKDEPTKEHLEMLLWAYSPDAAKVKKLIQETKESEDKKEESRKRRSSARDGSPTKKARED